MATHASTTSRRALLGAPMAVTAIPLATPAAAAPVPALVPNNPSCFELSLRAARLIREHQHTDLESTAEGGRSYNECRARMSDLTDEFEAVQARILRTRARTVPDAVAKLLVAMEMISVGMHDCEALEPLEQAEEAMRDCVIALSELVGVSLIDVAADWSDCPLMHRLMPELQRAFPAIYRD